MRGQGPTCGGGEEFPSTLKALKCKAGVVYIFFNGSTSQSSFHPFQGGRHQVLQLLRWGRAVSGEKGKDGRNERRKEQGRVKKRVKGEEVRKGRG